MSRALSFAVFFSIMLAVLGGAHYYVWARLVRDPALPPGATRAFTLLLAGLFVAIPVSLILRRLPGGSGLGPLWWVAMIWLGLLLLITTTLLASELVRGLLSAWRLGSHAAPLDGDRRLFLTRLVAGGVTLVAGCLGIVALREGLGRVAVQKLEITLSRFPKALSGTKIVQLTDVHIGRTIGRDFIARIVAETNACSPDLIAITGDLVDGSVDELREHVAPLANLRARYGVYFVTGNHEYYSGAEEWCEELRRLGIRVLRNEHVTIGDGDVSFDLAGVDDWHAEQFGGGHGADLPKALAGRNPERELVLLAHQPRAILEASRHDVGLQLSGHTHGGQIWPWNYLVRLQQPVVAGLARFGRSVIYVSRGTGYWGPPMRLRAPAEITEIILRAASA